MGGGAMIRGMARLMGVAAAGTAAMAPSSSPAFCHASTQEHSANMPSALHLSQKEASSGGVPSDMRFLNADDLEYSSDEDWGKLSYNRLVFSTAPSEEEVEEATKELHAALHLSIPASSSVEKESPTMPVVENEEKEFVPAIVNQERATEEQLPSLSAGLGLLAAGSSSVYQAFHLLQTNSKVQDAVKSLARDPAIWKAVLSNEKVLELTQTLQEGHETAASVIFKEENGETSILKLTSKVCDFVTGKVLQILDKVVEIVGSLFSSVEKAFFSKEHNGSIDKTVASCMMLAVAVLLVVLVKRVGK
ncbi:hypothetical protein GOP47_0013714 [Adiantum capillus-veneris]|uniref:Uncharacterized protein n=1 Tax=Adiantum capillus-veneris TaxID=13818 RepID=A0A9D4UQ99_ADICA|nr:hypothetical protein GOP47_0013714 [Adiantum capillus-veneris]